MGFQSKRRRNSLNWTKFRWNLSGKCLWFDVASRSTRRDRRRERCFVLPVEIHRMGSGRIHFDNSSMETDCEHQRLLVDLGEQLPDLNEDIQAFLSIVSPGKSFSARRGSLSSLILSKQEKWTRDKRHALINLLVQHLLQSDSFSSDFVERLQRAFPRYFLALIHRLSTAVNFSSQVTNQISIKQRFLVLLAQLIEAYPSLHTWETRLSFVSTELFVE